MGQEVARCVGDVSAVRLDRNLQQVLRGADDAYREAKVGRKRLWAEYMRLAAAALSRVVTPEVVKPIFGPPDSIRLMTCGEKHPDGAWSCKILT